ncbi:uncharacterized protein AMSG_01576 [Thecamonas trahens ATCC 50062]|uniref:Guanylate cyclase domain-containing protein n=1 Tax=Thecamonas trahens ATCC 50062 TaxID=461836 RepID=A0A0L0DRT0_THETB|nr:hypothetical protein AMSG_01576 [Thecamonas trahens ATCC 50062]KNC54726.1 hypothetical protein AMSG_01576 [Thecamonas trahens ATCC 50062]|eukprot:XP_013761626.1 hypothetical protein AMSG_01576 [Thecamonas trahens ATCC 50062]
MQEEYDFVETLKEESVRVTRIGLGIVAFIAALFGIVHFAYQTDIAVRVGPPSLALALFLAVTVCLPSAIIIAWMRPIVAATAGFILLVFLITKHSAEDLGPSPGLIVLTAGIYLVAPLIYAERVVVAWTVCIIFALTLAVWGEGNAGIRIGASFSSLVASLLGMIGTYLPSRALRTSFLTTRRLVATNDLLNAESVKQEAILNNLLPADVGAELKQSANIGASLTRSYVEASAPLSQRHNYVTVLFADVVGFTVLSQSMSARKLVDALDDLFARFDAVTTTLGLEKIKTIGDCYMAAGGLGARTPEEGRNATRAVARLALAIVSIIDEFNADRGTSLNMRVGLHSGPVIGGVIGTHRFSHDLWGPTVDMAATLESSGKPGCVHVSAASAAILEYIPGPGDPVSARRLAPGATAPSSLNQLAVRDDHYWILVPYKLLPQQKPSSTGVVRRSESMAHDLRSAMASTEDMTAQGAALHDLFFADALSQMADDGATTVDTYLLTTIGGVDPVLAAARSSSRTPRSAVSSTAELATLVSHFTQLHASGVETMGEETKSDKVLQTTIMASMRPWSCHVFRSAAVEANYQQHIRRLRVVRFREALAMVLVMVITFEVVDVMIGTFNAMPKRLGAVVVGVFAVGAAGFVRHPITETKHYFNVLASALVVMLCVSFTMRIQEEAEDGREAQRAAGILDGSAEELDQTTKSFINARMVLISLFSLLFGPLELLWTLMLHVVLLSAWHLFVMVEVRSLRSSLLGTDAFLLVIFVAGAIGVAHAERMSRYSFGLSEAMASRVAAVEAKQKQTEGLLLNILPQTIYDELGGEIRTIAHKYKASVLFAILDDVPDSLLPSEHLWLLNTFVSTVDAICNQYRVEKIKTVGTVYMAVSGLPDKNNDHALRLAAVALEIQAALPRISAAAANSLGLPGLALSVRIGINTGHVVGGVLGSLKSIFDCFGDTVNTASRMESFAPQSTIQISTACAAALDLQRARLLPHVDDTSFVTLTPRGATPIKGKGIMHPLILSAPASGAGTFLDACARL